MPRIRWCGWSFVHGRPACFAFAFFVLLLTLGGPLGAAVHGAHAQDDLGTPAGEVEEIQADPATEEPAQPPAEEIVDTPVDGEEPTAETPPVEEVDDAGKTATPDESAPAEQPTEAPTPTATPAIPTLVIGEAVRATCQLSSGQPDAIASGGSLHYDCRAELGLSASAVDPSQVAIDWQIDASAPGAWRVQLRESDEHPWSDVALPPVLAAQTTIGDVIPADDGGFASTQSETFELLVTRASCDLSPAEIQVQVSANPSLAGAVIGTSSLPEPIKLQPALASIGQPVVTFDGPLNFGSVSATASGPEDTSLSGTLGVTVSGMNATCGSWQIAIGGEGLVGNDGQPLTGSALLVLPAIDSGMPCDVRDGCRVAIVTGNAGADPTQDLALDLELRLGNAVLPGTFTTSLTVTITPADDPTSDGNGD